MEIKKYDLICVGGGIMSLTLAVMTKLLDPKKKIAIFERLNDVALESTAAWNNAGTGHSAFCELNYTPELEDGSIDVTKAEKVCKQFELSRQFWTFLVKKGWLKNPKSFIHPVPHHSWVRGQNNVEFLRKRYEAIKDHYMFDSIEYTNDPKKMAEWFPLIMEDRQSDEVLAATRVEDGVEMNFEALTHEYKSLLSTYEDLDFYFNHEVLDVDPDTDLDWTVKVKDIKMQLEKKYEGEHVFIGAGGGAIPLLQKVEIEEKAGYGGFPIGGQWLICKNKSIIERHMAKVYSKADVGSPPMSVPHLDTRMINGKQELLFGPFAGFSTKFLKEGSYMDLFNAIKLDNIPSMWGVFWHNLPLTKYLIEQVSMSREDRINELRKFIVNARSEDWELLKAGQRVQIIKKDKSDGGTLEFGTEVVSNPNGTITALLGASPGASTAVYVMMEVIHKAFPEILESKEGHAKMCEMIPMWNKNTSDHQSELIQLRKESKKILGLDHF